RARGRGLAGARLADQADDFARLDSQVDALDRDQRAVLAGELDPQRLDPEKAHVPPLSRPRSEIPSPIRPTPTPKSTSTRPGSVAIHQAVSRSPWPSAM